MKYLTETGIIISPEKDTLHIVEGYPGHVDFPASVIWKLHEKRPGSVYCLAHTHPPSMTDLSAEDMTTLQGWARAVYPFPMRMSVTTVVHDQTFITTTFLGIWDSHETWLQKGKSPDGREVRVYKEKSKFFTFPDGFIPEGLNYEQHQRYIKDERRKGKLNSWENLILRKSFEL